MNLSYYAARRLADTRKRREARSWAARAAVIVAQLRVMRGDVGVSGGCYRMVPVRAGSGGVLADGTTNHPPIDYDAAPVLSFVSDVPLADPFRAPDTDTEPTVPPYVPEKWPVGWDFLAAVVIAAACIAYVLWRWA